MTQPVMFDEYTSIRRLATLVLELGTEADQGRKPGRSFARTEILLHAMSVFNQRGLEDTSVQDLLDAANISRRTFYKYFSSKLEVLEHIFALCSRVLIARFETELPQTQSRAELIRCMLTIAFDYQFSLGRIIGMMMEEATRSASPLARHRLEMQQKLVMLLELHLERLGLSVPPQYRLMGLFWAVEGASLQILTQVQDAERPRAISECREQLLAIWDRTLA